MSATLRHVSTNVLDIAYEETGDPYGQPVILLHGFPYSPRVFDAMIPSLGQAGYRMIVPYLRGYGATQFLSSATMRSGQQAAIGQDLLDLMDALTINTAALMGFDWGGRGACVVAALWPERVRCLVTALGYAIQDIPAAAMPLSPEAEHRLWYQYYFHGPRGRAGLTANRAAIGKYLWQQWSPSWMFDAAAYEQTAAAFENPDFVEVVVHSYQHRFGYVEGDPALADIEHALTLQPIISVPTISLWGADDPLHPGPPPTRDVGQFSGHYEQRLLPGVGHNIPQEAPQATLAALQALLRD